MAERGLNLAGMDPGLQKMISMYLGAMPEPQDPYGDELAQLHALVGGANTGAANALGALGQAQNTPAPQTSPGQDATSELLGGLSQMLAPELNGLQQARGQRSGMEKDAKDKRLENLKAMESHYHDLAERADHLENTELSLKMRAKAEGYAAKQERLKEALQLGSRAFEAKQGRESAERMNNADNATVLQRATLDADAKLNQILAKNPGLMRHPTTGEIVPVRGIDDNEFNKAVVPLVRTYSEAKGNKKNDILPELKATFGQLKQSEAFNSTSYINRLRSVQNNPKAGMLGAIFKSKPESRYTPKEIARLTADNYEVDILAPGGVTSLVKMLKQAGYTEKTANDAVEAVLKDNQ